MLPDMTGTAVATTLYNQMEGGGIADIPMVMLSAVDKLHDPEATNEPKVVSRLLAKPLTEQAVQSLRQDILYANLYFFAKQDHDVLRQMSPASRKRMDTLCGMLQQQLMEFCDTLQRQETAVAELIQQTHAIKSGSLTLGFGKLAACMDMLEHSLKDKKQLFLMSNLVVLATVLRQVDLTGQNPAQRVALSS